MGYVSVMGYVSHVFMYMDIRKHINLIKNHGYEGKIGMIKKDVHGIVMLAAKAGDVVLYRPYKEDEDDMDKEASFANLVRDRDDDDKFAILWDFSSDDDLIMRNICHESFHIAMSVCQFCNMSLGFKVGEDEHAAYIAGFAGDCVSEFINSKNTD
jgi:hypothetical protein